MPESSPSPRRAAIGRCPDTSARSSDAGLEVVAATHRQPTLDDVFLALTGRSLREEAAAAEASAPESVAA